MKLADIYPAIAFVTAHPSVTELRGRTYLATYPGMIAVGATPGVSDEEKFYQLATLVYGWMPRIVRIDPAHSVDAVTAFGLGTSASQTTFRSVPVKSISDCLHSVVGASKLLHFANPNVFPIWDSNIEKFREIPDSDINSVSQYLDYVQEVHNIRAEPAFPEFFNVFSSAYSARLTANGIRPYAIGHIRAIEAAAFELAP
jgi:hypothetical protein